MADIALELGAWRGWAKAVDQQLTRLKGLPLDELQAELADLCEAVHHDVENGVIPASKKDD